MSPSRDFQDDSGRLWTAWDVIPSWGERRRGERRTRTLAQPSGAMERRRAERRRHRGIRIGLPDNLASGWLAFTSGVERRRLVPIPQAWDALPDDALRTLWRRAERLPDRHRRLIE